MKPNKLRFLIFFAVLAHLCSAQTDVGTIVKKITIKNGIEVFEDDSEQKTINEIKTKKFGSSKNAIPNFGWGKKTGWVKFQIQTKKDFKQTLLLHINSSVFDEISYYLFNESGIVDKYENIGSLTPIENRAFPHRDFVFPLKIQPNKNYTIYLKGKNQLNNLKFPIEIWEENAFLKAEKTSNLFWGIVIGILFLVALGNFVVGFLMQMRTFYFYGLYILSLIFVFLNLEGFIYELLPTTFYKNNYFDLRHVFNYSTFFFSMVFVVSFTKLSLIDKPYFERVARILQTFFLLSLGPTVLSPLWVNNVSDSFLQIWGWFGRILILIIILWCYLMVFASMKKNQMAKIFIIASIPPLLSYIIPQYEIFQIWIIQPYSYLVGFSTEIIILSIAMTFKIREFIFQKNTQIEVVKAENITPTTDNLSKREVEIIKAFTNGFTYQEIADAMFISPHTVRTHIKNIYQKLEINSKAEAVRYVMDNNL